MNKIFFPFLDVEGEMSVYGLNIKSENGLMVCSSLDEKKFEHSLLIFKGVVAAYIFKKGHINDALKFLQTGTEAVAKNKNERISIDSFSFSQEKNKEKAAVWFFYILKENNKRDKISRIYNGLLEILGDKKSICDYLSQNSEKEQLECFCKCLEYIKSDEGDLSFYKEEKESPPFDELDVCLFEKLLVNLI